MSTYDNLTGRLPPQSMLQQRYLIVSVAGRGGMSAVYRGVDTKKGNRNVAIKEMSQGHLTETEREEAIGRFRQEYQFLSKLQHPNLPLIYDTFNEGDRFYFVMDFIEGKTLLDLLRASGGRPLPIGQVVDYAMQLCDVLSFLHMQTPPVIFRDLKPTNVMIRGDGRLFLIDFGIARFFKEGKLQDTVLLGSPGYAPPEQHGTGQTSPRSDIYALGATMHCCLTGRDPFNAPDRFIFPPIRQYNPLVPAGLDQLVQSMLALNERQRPASAQEVRQALLNIKQQAAEHTSNLSPAAGSAPTQYPLPVPVRGDFQAPANNQPPAHLPTVPVRSSGVPASSTQPARSPIARFPQARTIAGLASIWTPRFLMVFIAMLLVTVAGSLLAFNIPNPYGSSKPFPPGLDHAVEFGLSVVFIIVVLIASTFVRNTIAKAILFVSALAMLLSAFAFLVQTIRDVQLAQPVIISAEGVQPVQSPFLSTIFNAGQLGQFFTIGLVAAALVSLVWLTRPYLLPDRIVLLVVFGIAAICAILQTFATSGDSDVTSHIYLLFALIALIQGVLIAVQTERVRMATK
ncbi:MAG TPA: serine/threonine-protein kinase [Ktedonobacteraceae bacterium]|nr:serine/threonine-protein kinase [Ktedonobacteraceae bacterium]